MKQLPHDHQEGGNPVFKHMPNETQFQTAAGILKILGDPNRIRIFWILCHCETCVMNLSAIVEMSSPAVSHHLKKLKSANLVTTRREGKEVYYTAADTPESALLHRTIEGMIAVACPNEE
ncbi:MAG: metalloregulator ArsR/SmtB family transcription factor [Clostridiales bacterium]|nr:metalloregulator ArsR/SmtB family transcription factor [Clostridiales bacterium]